MFAFLSHPMYVCIVYSTAFKVRYAPRFLDNTIYIIYLLCIVFTFILLLFYLLHKSSFFPIAYNTKLLHLPFFFFTSILLFFFLF